MRRQIRCFIVCKTSLIQPLFIVICLTKINTELILVIIKINSCHFALCTHHKKKWFLPWKTYIFTWKLKLFMKWKIKIFIQD